ncbi:DNA polymerase III subunit epsilon [Candidatus Termititenax dinenymphae]|uniref:DNA polymerase III subunit epsilon n=1 Tax=Candidatus Termititenax dinenymphae TaxID=2218523 RepID=A0A388TK60_9BACT|nr:DNA polymerase III subunit epsilon [Candidatus Termititenax dinenymphae]
MKDFAAIDFETANRHPSSVCSVGIVIVRNGEIAERLYHLIRPAPNYYNPYFTNEIHGLSRADTDNAEHFPQVWAEIVPKISGLPLVAHNSPFDEGCLKAVHEHYEMAYPNYEFHCTCRASRRAFKKLPNHQLHTVSKHCGYELIDHHNAIADAEACAVIALKVFAA